MIKNGKIYIFITFFCKFSQLFHLKTSKITKNFNFSGFATELDRIQYLEDCFLTIKTLFFESSCTLEKIGFHYLIYAIYYKQPAKEFCKFKLKLNEWIEFKSFFLDKLLIEIHSEAILIFWILYTGNCYKFVSANHDYGFEFYLNHTSGKTGESDEVGVNKKASEVISTEVNSMIDNSKGIIAGLEFLETGYNEMKEMLDIIPGTSNERMNLPKTDLISEIRDKLKNVSTMFNLMIPVKNSENRGDSSSEVDDGDDDYENVLAIGSKRVNLKYRALKGKSTEVPAKKISVTVLLDPETDNLKVTRPKFQYRRIIHTIEDRNFGPNCQELVKFFNFFNLIYFLD